MNSSRLNMLEQFLKEEPDDPFIAYALALEYLPSHPEKAQQLFERLLERHADYVPAYYHAGRLWLQAGDREKAAKILTLGIEKSRKAGDQKTTNEIQGLLDTLE